MGKGALWANGRWTLPRPPPLPSGSRLCPQVVLHRGARIKSFTNRFTFLPPAAGAGNLTFRALLKEGPANTGAFYRPAAALVLTEAAPATGGSVQGQQGRRGPATLRV